VKRLKLRRRLQAELNDEDIERHMALLRSRHTDLRGLQPTVLGSCRKHYTVPLFTPILLNEKFVQPLNVGDHWITVTNVFSTKSNELQLYDSSYRTVNESTVLQCSSLLRLHEQEDTITFSVRNYAQQTSGTRICGYYAVASMIAACERVDVSATIFDENVLVQELEDNVAVGESRTVTCIQVSEPMVRREVTLPKLWCICQRPSAGSMVQCDYCRSWFHVTCVRRQRNVEIDEPWSCSACSTRSERQRSALRSERATLPHASESSTRDTSPPTATSPHATDRSTRDMSPTPTEYPWGVDYRRIHHDDVIHLEEGNLAFTPIGLYIPDYLHKYVPKECLNTVLVKDRVIEDEVHDMYPKIGVTLLPYPRWDEPIDVQVTDLGEEFRRNVPIPVFNALIDVFQVPRITEDSER